MTTEFKASILAILNNFALKYFNNFNMLFLKKN